MTEKSTEFTARMLNSITEKLDGGTNYRTWSLDMQMILEANDYWGWIDGTEPRPKEAEKRTDGTPQPEEAEKAKERVLWDKKNRKVLALLILSVNPAEKEHIRDCVKASDAWERLEKMYSGKRTHRLLSKLKELTSLKLELVGTMSEYLRRSKQIVSELSVLGLKLDELAMKAFILNGLSEKYDVLVMTLESQIESLGLQDLSARLLEEAGKMGDRDSSDHVLFAGKGKSGVFCTYCGRHGHREEDGCRTKKFRERAGKGNSQATPPCHHCGSGRHGLDECPEVHGLGAGGKGERAESALEWIF